MPASAGLPITSCYSSIHVAKLGWWFGDVYGVLYTFVYHYMITWSSPPVSNLSPTIHMHAILPACAANPRTLPHYLLTPSLPPSYPPGPTAGFPPLPFPYATWSGMSHVFMQPLEQPRYSRWCATSSAKHVGLWVGGREGEKVATWLPVATL